MVFGIIFGNFGQIKNPLPIIAAYIKICTEKSEISQNSHFSYVIFFLCTTALSALSPSKVQ